MSMLSTTAKFPRFDVTRSIKINYILFERKKVEKNEIISNSQVIYFLSNPAMVTQLCQGL